MRVGSLGKIDGSLFAPQGDSTIYAGDERSRLQDVVVSGAEIHRLGIRFPSSVEKYEVDT